VILDFSALISVEERSINREERASEVDLLVGSNVKMIIFDLRDRRQQKKKLHVCINGIPEGNLGKVLRITFNILSFGMGRRKLR
jgi:hypothetical protein